MTTSQT